MNREAELNRVAAELSKAVDPTRVKVEAKAWPDGVTYLGAYGNGNGRVLARLVTAALKAAGVKPASVCRKAGVHDHVVWFRPAGTGRTPGDK